MKIISISAMVLIAVFVAACDGGGSGNGGNGDTGTDLEVAWIKDSGAPIATGQYDNGILTGYICYGYFEVTNGSGEFELSVVLENNVGGTIDDQTTSFSIEQGQLYRLSMTVNCSGPSDYDPGNPPIGFPNEFTLRFSTPSSTSSNDMTIQGGFHTNTLSCGQLSLDSWEYPTTMWNLQAKVLPEGSGSISDSLGLLVYEGTRPNRVGDFYVGEYEHGTEITLTAIPATGYIFDHWYGTWWTNEPQDLSVTFTIGIPILIEAHFVAE
jgi:List-Bact-rpt repeat protein